MAINLTTNQGPPRGLTRRQRTNIFNVIQSRGNNTDDFEWETVPSSDNRAVQVDMLRHKSTGSYFIFDWYTSGFGQESRYARYSPGADETSENLNVGDWDGMVMMFAHWLDYIDEEWGHPDMWEEATKAHFNDSWQDNNTRFTGEEITHLTFRMEEVRQYLLNVAGDDDQKAISINNTVDSVIATLPDMRRQDWLMLLYGYIFTHIADWALTRAHLVAIVAIIKEGVKFLATHH